MPRLLFSNSFLFQTVSQILTQIYVCCLSVHKPRSPAPRDKAKKRSRPCQRGFPHYLTFSNWEFGFQDENRNKLPKTFTKLPRKTIVNQEVKCAEAIRRSGHVQNSIEVDAVFRSIFFDTASGEHKAQFFQDGPYHVVVEVDPQICAWCRANPGEKMISQLGDAEFTQTETRAMVQCTRASPIEFAQGSPQHCGVLCVLNIIKILRIYDASIVTKKFNKLGASIRTDMASATPALTWTKETLLRKLLHDNTSRRYIFSNIPWMLSLRTGVYLCVCGTHAIVIWLRDDGSESMLIDPALDRIYLYNESNLDIIIRKSGPIISLSQVVRHI